MPDPATSQLPASLDVWACPFPGCGSWSLDRFNDHLHAEPDAPGPLRSFAPVLQRYVRADASDETVERAAFALYVEEFRGFGFSDQEHRLRWDQSSSKVVFRERARQALLAAHSPQHPSTPSGSS